MHSLFYVIDSVLTFIYCFSSDLTFYPVFVHFINGAIIYFRDSNSKLKFEPFFGVQLGDTELSTELLQLFHLSVRALEAFPYQKGAHAPRSSSGAFDDHSRLLSSLHNFFQKVNFEFKKQILFTQSGEMLYAW